MSTEHAQSAIRTETWQITGMTCVNCQNKLQSALAAADGVVTARVSYANGTATVSYDGTATDAARLAQVIVTAGYGIRDAQAGRTDDTRTATADILGLLFVVLAAFLLIQHFGLTRYFTAVPTAAAGMGLVALFLMGVVTSLHCIAMCGGIELAVGLSSSVSAPDSSLAYINTPRSSSGTDTKQSKAHSGSGASSSVSEPDSSLAHMNGGGVRPAPQRFLPALLYNAGRVVSYTLVGAAVGALGGVISFNGIAKGIVQIIAGVFMLIMGLNLMGIAPRVLRRLNLRLPASWTGRLRGAGGGTAGDATTQRRRRSKLTPLIVGLANGLMPCGPLQAMQLYALSTASPVRGAAAMFAFALGTTPLMLGLGALAGILKARFTRVAMQIGAVAVLVLGLVMLTTGMTLSGIRLPRMLAGPTTTGNVVATRTGDIQQVTTTLESGDYQPISVVVGVPVKWTIQATDRTINGCNGTMQIPEYGIEHEFQPGDNIIEFTPTRTGTFGYSCWMGMIRSTITVTDVTGGSAAQTDAIDVTDTIDVTGRVQAAAQTASQTTALSEGDPNDDESTNTATENVPQTGGARCGMADSAGTASTDSAGGCPCCGGAGSL
ncbi:MAG: sulfite exporter TauE/SafE family protein [Actinomycetes bacterium]|jgi:sulfite exporter TauE/SafE/copper chaperone CopZ|nr:sulfite exporter TauE/SafE family protein [Actinomycetes bacterium]